MRDAHILILSTCSVCPTNQQTHEVVTDVDANGDVDKMDKCPKCGVPAIQVVDGECIECRLFQKHRDPEPVTYADKLKDLLSRAGNQTFFSLLPDLWSGKIAVQICPVPKGKACKYLYFDKGNLSTSVIYFDTNAYADSKLSIFDMQSDTWHFLPEDMEFSSPINDREERCIRLLNRTDTPERMRFFASCEHADTWMEQ